MSSLILLRRVLRRQRPLGQIGKLSYNSNSSVDRKIFNCATALLTERFLHVVSAPADGAGTKLNIITSSTAYCNMPKPFCQEQAIKNFSVKGSFKNYSHRFCLQFIHNYNLLWDGNGSIRKNGKIVHQKFRKI